MSKTSRPFSIRLIPTQVPGGITDEMKSKEAYVMFIQGDLQVVFDALYKMGVIDPVLKMDWQTLRDRMDQSPQRLDQALRRINACAGNPVSLLETLKTLDAETMNFVALEVARELAEFTDRKTLH